MEIYHILFDIVLYLTEGAMIFYYARSMFMQKYNSAISIAGISAGYLILMLIYKLDVSYLNAASILVINTSIFIFLYNCNFKSAIFHSVLLAVLMAICEYIMMSAISLILNINFNAYQSDFNIHMLNVITSKLIYYIILLVTVNLFPKQKAQAGGKSVFWVLFIMPLSSLLVTFTFIYATFQIKLTKWMSIISSVVFLLLLIANIVVFFIYEYSIRNAQKLFEYETEKQKQEIDRKYLGILEQNNKDLKIFTHDIKNHLEQISNLTDDERIKSYIGKIYKEVNQYGMAALSGNKTLDVIIGKYQTLAGSKGLSISFNTKTSNLSDVDIFDLSAIMNNLLDNAVEAAEKSSGKKICVDIAAKNDFEIIKIQNSCDTPPMASGKKLITSKKNKAMHGLGMESVAKTVKKHDGFFEWEYNENMKIFETTVAIPTTE